MCRQIHRDIPILHDVDDPNVVKCHDMYDHNSEIQILLEFMDEGLLEGKHVPQENQLVEGDRNVTVMGRCNSNSGAVGWQWC